MDLSADQSPNTISAMLADLPDEVLRITASFQTRIAECLLDIGRLDGLNNLAAAHRLPSLVLKLFRKAIDLFDESTQYLLGYLRRRGIVTTCEPGCTYCCCHMPFGISTIELICLYDAVLESGIQARIFRRCLEAEEMWNDIVHQGLDGSVRGESKGITREAILKSYHNCEQPCPFLMNGLCQVYSSRPLACRMHFSLSRSYWCSPSHFQHAYAREFSLEPSDGVYRCLEELDDRFNLNLSGVLVCGLLELTVNVMQFEEIHWTA